jgi:hypothetical protein
VNPNARGAVLLALLAPVSIGCVVWPAGAGPDASPLPLARAIELRDQGQAVLIDVRSRGSYLRGHIPGALSMPLPEIADRAAAIRRLGLMPILYCG